MLRLTLRDVGKISSKFKNVKYQAYSNSCVPKQAGFGKAILVLTPLAAFGGIVLGYYDEDFRKALQKNFPQLAATLKLEEGKPLDSVLKQMSNISHSVINTFEATPTKNTSEPKIAKKKNDEIIESKAPIAKTPTVTKQNENKPDDILGLEKEIEIEANLTVHELNKAINTLNSYNNEVRNILDSDDIDPKLWTALKNKTNVRDSSVKNAVESVNKTMKKIETYEKTLSKMGNASNSDQVLKIRNKIRTLTDHINGVKNDLYTLRDSSFISDNCWKKVEASRSYFAEQIEALFPGINLADKKIKMSPNDLDLFLFYAYSHVLAYQKELLRLQTEGELRLKRVIDASRGSDQSVALNAQLDFYLENEKRKLAVENKTKIMNIRNDFEKQLRNQLKKQVEVYVDHLNDTIASKEAELTRNMSLELENVIGKEKSNYKLQLASIHGKLRGINAALKARTESDLSAHMAQVLWTSSQALWTTLEAKSLNAHSDNELRSVNNEIAVLKKMCGDDELVSTIIDNLPNSVKERGVFSQDALCERFANVEKICRNVVLVSEKGSRLPIFFLSYLQSLFTVSQSDPLSLDEVKNKSKNFRTMETFDILNKASKCGNEELATVALEVSHVFHNFKHNLSHNSLDCGLILLKKTASDSSLCGKISCGTTKAEAAAMVLGEQALECVFAFFERKYCVVRGDLLQALKYMNLLQDAPRKVASDWINETRLFLETQQAANTLLTFTAAYGLLNL